MGCAGNIRSRTIKLDIYIYTRCLHTAYVYIYIPKSFFNERCKFNYDLEQVTVTMITRLLLFWDTDEVQKFRNMRRHFWMCMCSRSCRIKRHVDERGALGVEEITVDEIRIRSLNNQNSMECHCLFFASWLT